MLLRLALALLIALLVLHVSPKAASSAPNYDGAALCGSNGLKVCLTTASPFIKNYVTPHGDVTYCVNPRGKQYPGFEAQVKETMVAYAADNFFTAREVDYPSDPTSTACIIRNDMLDDHPCSGCGAWVYTQNIPVLIEYNAKAGYSLWYSTVGHEMGHAACLLDEGYDKAGFVSYILTYGTWKWGYPTVMDVGTPYLNEYAPRGIWQPTSDDLDRCSETAHRTLGDVAYTGCTTYAGWEGTTSCYWPQYNQWIWAIPLNGHNSLWRWSDADPTWRCTDGCPQ